MAAFCVNTHSQEFKDAAKRLGVSQFELEQIAYKYGNQEGTFGQFPSDEYIKEQLDGVPNYNATEAQAELWKMRYSTPREFDTLEELNAAKKDALQYFDSESVRFFLNSDGKYELRVGEQSYLESPEKELRDAEDDANALTKKIIELEKQLRSKHIYESTISTSDGDITVSISDTNKDANEDVIWLSSGRSIFGAVSMSIESNLKEGIIGGSILFPNISVSNRENNYVRISNPIRNKHAVILRQLLKQFIDAGKKYPVSKWQTETDFAPQQLKYKIDNLSSLLGIDVSEYFRQEERVFDYDENTTEYIKATRSEQLEIGEDEEVGGEVQERVVINAQGLYDMLSVLAGNDEFSAIEEAIQYNEAYNEASKIGFGKANKKNRKQLENELRSTNRERDALWNKIRSLKDEVRRMKSSPWAFDAEEDLPFQKGQADDTTQVPAVPKGYEYKVGYDNRIILHSTTFRPDRYNGPREIEYSFKDGEIYLQKWHKDARHGWYYEWKKATNPPVDVKKFFEEYSANEAKSQVAPQTTGLPDQMTADEVYDILSKQYAPDSSEAKLSKLVFNTLQNTGILFKAADLPMGVRGRFVASESTIQYSKDGILDNTLLHEAIHAVSIYYMKLANQEGVPNEIKVAVKEIEECYTLLKEYLLDRETKNGGSRDAIFGYLTSGFGGYYGISSATELVAEITNPNIVSLIKEYDEVHKGQNVFKRLIDAIAKFFGINKAYGSLEKTLKEALVTLIENPSTELMQRYALENKTLKDNYTNLDNAEKAIVFGARRVAENALENAEFDENGEYETTLNVPLKDVQDGYVYQRVKDAHHELTQSPVGAIFKIYSGNGFGTFLLNGPVSISTDTVSIPIKAINRQWLSTHIFDITTSQNGVAYITNVNSLYDNQSAVEERYVNHSGGARQADSYWGEIGEKYGVTSKHYYHGAKTPNGNTVQSDADFQEGLAKVKKAAQDMGRVWSDKYADLLARNWNQVKYADAVYAVSSIVRAGEKNRKGYLVKSLQVDGGTGYAVQMAINEGKPVYVFDQKTNQWHEYSYAQKDFIPTDTPTLSRNFAGIGTSTSLTDAGRKAIEDVYAKTFNQPQQQSQQTIDIWAGKNPVNSDLSNMAIRPFTYNGVTYNSVEQAFQSAKLGYAAPITQQYPDVQAALNNPNLSPFDAKTFGNKILGLDTARWDAEKFDIMKTLIKESFKQNPQALQRLLATGDAILTHTREREDSRWRTEFPRILMEVRDELRGEQSSTLAKQVATQGKTEQYGVVIDRQLKGHWRQWQQDNPNGIVAYRANFKVVSPIDHTYNRAIEAQEGKIGNPFSEGEGQTNKGIDTVQKFYEWLTTGNSFGEPLANEEYRQAILQRLLATPVGTPILYYTELGRPSHATILGYLVNHKELIQSQVIQQAPETKSQEEPLWSPPKVERVFHEREETIVTKMDNLLQSGNMTVTEVMAEANKVMDWISDQLTQYLEDPSIVWDKLSNEDSKKTGKTKEEFITQISKMSRKELVDFLGVDNLISFYTNDVLSLVETDEAAGIIGNEDIFENFEDEDYDRLDLIKDNIQGLIQYGYTRFLAREGFGFQLSDVEGETFTTTEEVEPEDKISTDDYNSKGVDYNEEVRNQQEHWQIENATRDIMDNASVKVKQAISDCYILENNGKVKEDGTPDYDIATDSLNRNERVNPIHAVRSIVKWTQGAIKLSQMVDKLKAQEKNNPWISQIITRLEDRTGNESDFQSQFFNTFSKHFQTYSIVKLDSKGKYYTMTVNEHPALKDAMDNIIVQRKTGGWPLVNENGLINLSALDSFQGFVNTLENFEDLDEDNRHGVIDMIGGILFTLGLPQSPEVIDRILTNTLKNSIWTNADAIYKELSDASKENIKNYNPFEYGGKHGIRSYVSKIIRPFTDVLEETMVSSVFDSGKMYQSFITPSWTTKLFQKMHLPDREFKEFVLQEFGDSEWFVNPEVNMLDGLSEESLQGLSEDDRNAAILQAKIDYISDPKHSNIWRTPWLGVLMRMSPEQRQEAFQHKVQLNFNKQNYMRGMDDLTYVLSVFTEYFGEPAVKEKGGYMFANYRFPMLSNKPSNEFVRFVRYGTIGTTDFIGDGAKAILNGYVNIFRQELSRIQTVEMRNLKEGDEGYITNFDANEGKGSGLRFNFLDFLNEYLSGSKKNTTLGKLIDRKLHGTQSTALPDGVSALHTTSSTKYISSVPFTLTAEENKTLEDLVKKETSNYLNALANRLISTYKSNGLFEALKGVEGVGKTDYEVEGAIREFAWNDHFAQANLLQILVTDKAFYKNEEDLQKRLAQVHSPGIRGNWEAFDFGERDEKGQLVRAPQKVSDGKLRVVKLNDFIAKKELVGNIIANLESVFGKKIEDAPEDEREALKGLKDNIIDAYRKVNVVDGQAFVSPTAYRKKAIAFGEWTKDDEQVYKDLMDGKFNMAQVQKVFNPRKPFTYGKTTKRSNPELNTPIKNIRYGVQYKDSEYLLIMADALMRGQNTGRPNLLGAIFDVMEESYKTDSTQGIDFFVFDSGVKTGLMGAVSINEFVDNPDGQRLAKEKLEAFIYKDGKVGGIYDENYVDVLDAEDYTTQQTVPEHFMHGSLQWGSQIRALMPSDLETTYGGQPVVYEYKDPSTGETIQKSAEEIRRDWEQNTANMVNKSVAEIRRELGLDGKMSTADSNILISKILQREILSNPRYGVDLLLACSVDADGNFRIPLGDPIQSKRVEQLLSSIIKNRINKQKVAGGTLVEVTNFGTSKRLNIRFKDKNDVEGNRLLDTMDEYLAKGHTEKEFKEYIKENQGGIAYYECYAPAWTRDLFLKFADEKGNIDVEAIEMLDPDLLKMYGYRIPTEDKYSTAPYKIVGFLPQEAGDGFMQPWETTVIDGSDFDVDKKNLMRMDLNLKSSIMSKREYFEQEGIAKETEEAKNKYEQYKKGALKSISVGEVLKRLGDLREFSVSELEKTDIDWYEKSLYRRDREALKNERNSRNEQAEDTFDRRYKEEGLDKLDAAINELESKEDLTAADEEKLEEYKKDYDKKYDKLTKSLDTIRANNERWYKEAVEERRKRLGDTFRKAIIRRMLQYGIFKNSSQIPENERALFKAVKQAYISLAFKVERPEAGTKGYYNNLMFNMQWAIATHASTADKILNPGNFDSQKRTGYMVEANRLGHNWNELQKMDIGELKDLVFTSKNLMDFDVQTQFYKQNSVAGQVLGIFAVAKSAHAMFESRNYGVLVERPFYIDGMEFSGAMHYDHKYDRKGNLIGKTLGSLVSASADAVKDPVLNLMNINKETINVLNTALRLGMDFETIALVLSSNAVGNVLEQYRRNSLTRKTSFDREIKAVLRELEKKNYIGKDSALQRQNLSKEEIIWAVKGLRIEQPTKEDIEYADKIVYKALNAVLGLSEISRKIQPLSDLSRLNSMTSAPGPLYIDTITSERKLGSYINMDGIIKFYTNNSDVENYEPATRGMVFEELKSLEAFYESYNITKELFRRLNFTTASNQFTNVLNAVPAELQFSLYSNDALLKSLADFFQSYLLVQSGVIKSSELKRYTTEFVKDFLEGKLTQDEKVKNNPFIQAIQPKLISKEGEADRYALNIDTTGMEQAEKDALSAGWIQLEKDNPELSHKLFAYNFFRGGIGFSPKSFMSLVPIQVKESIGGYIETFMHIPDITNPENVVDQWVRNNWTNTELVTRIKDKPCDESTRFIEFSGYKELSSVYNSPYIRVSNQNGEFLFREHSRGEKRVVYEQVDPLGGNREYIEIYSEPGYTPMDNLQRGQVSFETQDTEVTEIREDNPEVLQTAEEQMRDLSDFYQMAYGEEEANSEGAQIAEEHFDTANKDLDIRTNKDKFDEIMENFC